MYTYSKSGKLTVSIHAPREGCDFGGRTIHGIDAIVSIHAPREGCDWRRVRYPFSWRVFQFTHPGRGATCFIASE